MLRSLRTGLIATSLLLGTAACDLLPVDLRQPSDGWTVTPTADDQTLAAAARQFCIDAHQFVPAPAIEIQDQRGPDGAAFLWRDGDREASCFVYRTSDGELQATGWNEWHWGPNPMDFLSDTSSPIAGGPQWASGPTGPGVSSVDIELTDGTLVSASVADGYFLAWWPRPTELASLVSKDANGVRLDEVQWRDVASP
jgi:hypothetical protein